MRDNRRAFVGFPRLDCAPVTQLPVFVYKLIQIRESMVIALGTRTEKMLPHLLKNCITCLPDLSHHCFRVQYFRHQAVIIAFAYKKHYHRNISAVALQLFIEKTQRLQCQIKTLVLKLETSRGKKVYRLVEIKGIRMKEVRRNKLMNAFLKLRMQNLYFVLRLKTMDVQSVWQNRIGFPVQKMKTFLRRNLTNRCKKVARLSTVIFYRLLDFNSELARLCFPIKKRKMRVELG